MTKRAKRFGWSSLKEVRIIANPEDVDTSDVVRWQRHVRKKQMNNPSRITQQKEK